MNSIVIHLTLIYITITPGLTNTVPYHEYDVFPGRRQVRESGSNRPENAHVNNNDSYYHNIGASDDQSSQSVNTFCSHNEKDWCGKQSLSDNDGITIASNVLRGLEYLKNSRLNKDMGFSLEERQSIGIHGLIPPRFKTQEEQLKLCMANLNRYQDNFKKYLYLMNLLDRNERLFYRLVIENVAELMPIVYTPTVGLACQQYSLIYERPRGLFITIHDKGYIYEIVKNWPETNVRAIVVTDGEHILGLGDLGANGMCIPVGKLMLYTVLGGLKPHHCLPITLDVGTNNEDLLKDEFYMGLHQKRVEGAEYDDFIDEFMRAIVKRYGQNTLIQFEDFGNKNALRLLKKYESKYCTYNGDIQGTASIALAGLLTSLKVKGVRRKLSEHKIVLYGAGDVALGIAEYCVMTMVKEGISEEEAHSKIWLVDSEGLIVQGREGLKEEQMKFAQAYKQIPKLKDIVVDIKPSILIGISAVANAFTPEIIKEMAKNNDRPIIFALSNPTSKSECTAEEAYVNTDGRGIFVSGSPFKPFTYKNTTFYPGQGNNAYIFPGVALGVISAGLLHISDKIFLDAAETLSNLVTDEDLEKGSLYPDFKNIREYSIKIAVDVVKMAYKNGNATTYPEPNNKEAFVRYQLYNYTYQNTLPPMYKWPNL